MADDTPARPDQVATGLAAIRERWDTAENTTWQDYQSALEHLGKALRSLADIPRLLGAVKAARNLAAEWDQEADSAGKLAKRRTSPAAIMLSERAGTLSGCAAALREAIARELLGEVPADGT